MTKYTKPCITSKKVKISKFLSMGKNSSTEGFFVPQALAFAYCDTSQCGSGTSVCWYGSTPPGFPR